ncbi:hypothetical protein AcV5_003365 [Taiwanofungus camphoratus]|nr:hypothetical protein AcV5_003365 [Antrodia cinnamomea]
MSDLLSRFIPSVQDSLGRIIGGTIACPDTDPPASDSPATPANGAAPPLLPDGTGAQPTGAAPGGSLADAEGGGGSWVHSGTCDAAQINGPDWDGGDGGSIVHPGCSNGGGQDLPAEDADGGGSIIQSDG